MNYIKFNFYSITLVLSMIILSGCNSDSTISASNNQEGLSNMPEGVQNGTVSADYYKELVYMIDYFTSYSEEIFLTDSIDYGNVEEKSRDYLVDINSLNLMPQTEADSDLDTYAIDFKTQSELIADYMIDYATKREQMYYEMAADYIVDASNTLKTIEQISVKYNINN